MGRYSRQDFGSRSIRNRLLAIAWIPSLTLLAIGLAVSIALARNGAQVQAFGSTLQKLSGPSAAYFSAVEQERQLTILMLADPTTVSHVELNEVRDSVDAAATATVKSHAGLVEYASPALRQQVQDGDGPVHRLDLGRPGHPAACCLRRHGPTVRPTVTRT